jgi:hypothetical protein
MYKGTLLPYNGQENATSATTPVENVNTRERQIYQKLYRKLIIRRASNHRKLQ